MLRLSFPSPCAQLPTTVGQRPHRDIAGTCWEETQSNRPPLPKTPYLTESQLTAGVREPMPLRVKI